MDERLSSTCIYLTHILLVGLLLLIGVVPRMQNRSDFRPPLFRGTDSYRFYRQAEIIVQQGQLPERDMDRWLPEGRNLRTHLNASSYLLAYLYRAAHRLAPRLTLYQVASVYSVICFAASALIFLLPSASLMHPE